MSRINGLIYDAEIKLCIPEKNVKRDPSFQYCAGWTDYKNMGIACVCVYDMWERMPRIFTAGNFGEMVELFGQREEIIGFNSIGFDDPLLNAFGHKVKTTYDLLPMLKEACGEPKNYTKGVSRGGFSLNQILKDNNLPSKTGNGGDAPRNWQAGFHGKVIDYCMADVMLTYRLFLKRNSLYVGSYDKTVELKEIPSLREAQKQAKLDAAKKERDNW